MRIRFLGTGTSVGVPLIGCQCEVCQSKDKKDKRLRTSVLIEHKGKNIVIDTGPDFRQQMLRENISRLDAVLYTHEHRDHIAGMDELRAFNFITKQAIDIYAEKNVQKALKDSFPYVFGANQYPGIPKINMHTISEEEFDIDGISIIPVRAMHYKLPILGFRIDNFTYITDAKYISDEEKEKIYGSRVIVLNALRQKPHISHFSLDEALELIREFAPEKAYFIHMSHNIGLHKEIEKKLPAHIHLAYDGLSINIE
ncbi:MAG: MBL fold metallo-hydrolase [Bacteroidales bacterium]